MTQASITGLLKREAVFFAASAAAIVTSIFVRPDVRAIDAGVILTLFCLMLVNQGFEDSGLIDRIASAVIRRARSEASVALTMTLTTGLLAMLVTNDVALLAVVPLSVRIGRRCGMDPFRIVTFEALAANIGSSLTPFGNPQNLYLFSYFKADTAGFFAASFTFPLAGMAVLALMTLTLSREKVHVEADTAEIRSMPDLAARIILFAAVILSVLHILDRLAVAAVLVLYFLIRARKLFFRVDYFLLATFAAFFIFVDNLTRIPALKETLTRAADGDARIFLLAAGLSQAISNVPAAIILSPFAAHLKPLLLGVSVGGMGTLIASLANLIAYRIYAADRPPARMLRYFLKVNAALLLLFTAAYSVLFFYGTIF